MRDWNNDGQIDSRDGFIDYMIYKKTTKTDGESENCSNHYRNGEGSNVLGIGLLIVGIVVLIGLLS